MTKWTFCILLRLCLVPFDVKVLCIEPGFFKTNVTDSGILRRNVMMLWNKLPQDIKQDYGEAYLNQGKIHRLSIVEIL